jgi:seryl-tRNA synthetase
MNANEIKAKYEGRKCESQVEFDRVMSEMNAEQTQLNHPYLDRDRELAKQRENLMMQMDAIKIQLKGIAVERLELEQKRKDINRLFHDLKHELIMANPREKYAKAATC